MSGVRRGRRAFSLLEVLIATALFLGALAVLGQLVSLGMRSAERTRTLAAAQLACESKLAEIIAGVELGGAPSGDSSASEQFVPLAEARGWLYVAERLACDDGTTCVRVRVKQELPDDKRPLEFELSRRITTDADVASGTTRGSDSTPVDVAIGGGVAALSERPR